MKVSASGTSVDVAFDGPKQAELLLFLAHGAGGDLHGEFMAAIATLLARHGVRVCRFNFPYSQQGRRSPDRQELLENTYSSVVEEVRADEGGKHVFVGGKSLGGRIASHAVADGMAAEGLVFLGYPLHPPGRPDRLRKGHLTTITAPMLFVEGTRDPFCPLETLEAVRRELRAATTVAVIDDGDHSLKVRKSSGRTTKEAWAEAADAVATWLKKRISA